MGIAADLVNAWKSEGVKLNGGAREPELRAFRNLLGVELGEDLCELYCLADGMVDLEYDVRQVSFWSIAKILAGVGASTSSAPAFADFLIESWYFRLGVNTAGLVVLTDNVALHQPLEELGSFSDFLQSYTEDPNRLGIFDPRRGSSPNGAR